MRRFPFFFRPQSFIAAALLALAIPGAEAQRFSVLPVVLEVDPQRSMTTQTTFTNLDRIPVQFKVEVFEWSSKDGQDILTPTSDVLVNPPSFTLAPDGKQVIRVGVRRKPGERELTYRVFIRQVPMSDQTPKAAEESGAKVTVLLNLSLPVYIASPSATSKVSYHVRRDGKDLALLIQNDGTRRHTYRDLEVKAGERNVKLESKAVLAGAYFKLPLPNWGDAANELTVTYRDITDKEISTRVPIPPR